MSNFEMSVEENGFGSNWQSGKLTGGLFERSEMSFGFFGFLIYRWGFGGSFPRRGEVSFINIMVCPYFSFPKNNLYLNVFHRDSLSHTSGHVANDPKCKCSKTSLDHLQCSEFGNDLNFKPYLLKYFGCKCCKWSKL